MISRVINSSFWEVDEVSSSLALSSLPMELSKHFPKIFHDTISRKALDLLNNPVALSRSPSIAVSNTEKVYLFAGK